MPFRPWLLPVGTAVAAVLVVSGINPRERTTGQGADAIPGTQGDPWDTQSDMGMALLGALCAVVRLVGIHDRQLARMSRFVSHGEAG